MTSSPESKRPPVGVLYIHSSASHYGSDNALFNLIRGLDKERFRAVVVVPEEGPLIARLEAIGVRVVRMPLAVLHRTLSPVFWLRFFTNLAFSARRLAQLIREESIGLIHSNTSHVFDGAVAAAVAGIPHLWQVREINTWRSALAPFLRIPVARLSSKLVCVSQATRTALALPVRYEDKSLVIVDGIDLADFDARTHPGEFRRSLDLSPECPLVGLVGRIVQWKGHEIFIRAAHEIRRRVPEVRFAIIGEAVTDKDKRFRESLVRMVEEQQLGDAVIFTGARDDIATVMKDIDILAVPTLRGEAWGLVALEGMAAGTPVVACDRDGPAEIIATGRDGFLIDAEHAEALATAVLRLLESPDLRRSVGEAARRTVQDRFTLARTVNEFSALYREMLKER